MKYDKYKVAIIVLNWNTWKDTIECLKSLNQINYPNYNVIVVDNGSVDQSIEKIEKFCETNNIFYEYLEYYENSHDVTYFKKFNRDFTERNRNNLRLTIIKNKYNYGFTKGNNVGISYAKEIFDPCYILLLNNDTVVENNFLNELVYYGVKNPKVGFLSPKIYFFDYNGKKNIIQYAGAKQNLWFLNIKIIGIFEKDQGKYNNLTKTDVAHGSCLLAKNVMLKQIGLLDEDLFSYREENDWCLRGYKEGWESLYVPSSIIWHKGGKSSGGYLSPLTIFYKTRNDFILIKKHGNILQKVCFYVYFFIFKFWLMVGIYLIYHRNYKAFITFFKGVKEGLLW
ncbi:glycosyltransferase family 2 protein [Methanobacterium ferruginis]|uniref:glycosyltransferase family 2 protein n=1 Tax=Methanobacterium ferruginis TaxID=710191 RepID=UPI002573B2D7|nr:glycosyltransferase family 2 protein [Methanobacterium ferruginis]BDZ69000.1 glycosyl transferase family 2 [Methanobacterium ferruginis]